MAHPFPAQRAFGVVLAVLLVLSLVPSRWLGLVGDVAVVPRLLHAPISEPLRALGRRLRPARPEKEQGEAVRLAEEEAERATLRAQQLEVENERLRQVLAQRDITDTIDPRLDVRHVVVGIYASSSDLGGGTLRLSAGALDGVRPGAVAIGPGLQLVGHVASVDPKTSALIPITSIGAPAIGAVIVTRDNADAAPETVECLLRPIPGGRLKGDVLHKIDPTTNAPIVPEVGQLVRLADPAWPKSAQRLIVGRVRAVEQSPTSAERRLVVVSPLIDRLDRLGEVTLRVESLATGSLPTGDPKRTGGRP